MSCRITSLNGWQWMKRVTAGTSENAQAQVADVYAKEGTCLVAFRGTDDLTDLSSDFSIGGVSLGSSGATVLNGVAQYYLALKDGVLEACADAGASAATSIVSTGHSLGGGAAIAMATDGKAGEAWSYAAPKMFLTGGNYTSADGLCPTTIPGYQFYNMFRFEAANSSSSAPTGAQPALEYNDIIASLSSCILPFSEPCVGSHCSSHNVRLTQECWDVACANSKGGEFPKYAQDDMPRSEPSGSLMEQIMQSPMAFYVHSSALYLENLREWARAEARTSAWALERRGVTR